MEIPSIEITELGMVGFNASSNRTAIGFAVNLPQFRYVDTYQVQDNVTLEAITGGALDANESEPGPIMLQGDHEKVWYRKVTVTPITDARK